MTAVRILDGKNLKQGDTHPNLRLQLLEDGMDKNLTGFTGQIRIRGTRSDTVIVDSPVDIVDPVNGIVEYDWTAGDTSSPGIYQAEVTIDDGAGTVMTFPNSGWFHINIEAVIS